jgi:hypothetical protein
MNYILNRAKEKILLHLFKLVYPGKKDKIINPFFILSPGRSGSTFLRKEIITWTNANIPPETGDLIPEAMMVYVKCYFLRWEIKVDRILHVFERFKEFRYWNINLTNVRNRLIKYKTGSLQVIIKSLYDEYADTHDFNRDFWGDKTPYLTERIKWIKILFPDSKLIFIDRNTEEIIKSRMLNFNESFEEADRRIRLARKSIQEVEIKGEKIFRINLDELIDDKEKHLIRIINFIGGVILAERKKDFFLGDDVLQHHSKLYKH